MIDLNRKELGLFEAGGGGVLRRYPEPVPIQVGAREVLTSRWVAGAADKPLAVAEVIVTSLRPVRVDALETIWETLQMDGWRGLPEVRAHLQRRYPGLRADAVLHYVRFRVERKAEA